MRKFSIVLFLLATFVPLRAEEPPNLSDAAGALLAGDLPRAVKLYRAVYDSGEQGPPILLGLARLALWQNQLDEAAKFAGQIEPKSVEGRNVQGLQQTIAARQAGAAPAWEKNLPNESLMLPFLKGLGPAVLGKINGHEARLLISASADGVVLESEFARKAGLKTAPSQESAAPLPNGGAVPEKVEGEVALGRIRLAQVPIAVRALPNSAGQQLDGLIGQRFLPRFRTTIDSPRARWTLVPRENKGSGGGRELPLWWVGEHQLYLSGSLNGKEVGMWLIDTTRRGASLVVWDRSILDEAAINLDFKNGSDDQKAESAAAQQPGFTASKFALGEVSASGLRGQFIAASPLASPPPFRVAGIVTYDFFKRWAVTVDLEKMQVGLKR